MGATLLAFTNSAAECFIIMNSIFFGVSDIGISTVVQQSAFYQLVIQGGFYLIAETGTRIDWWVITRDTLFFIIYLVIMTIFLSSNSITLTNAFILIAFYVVHIFAMKWNIIYEVAIKKNVARFMEVRELTKLAHTDIDFYHKVLNSRALNIEALSKLDYKVENKHIVFDDKYRKRIKEPKVALSEDDAPYSMMDDRGYAAKMLWKKAAMKVLIRI